MAQKSEGLNFEITSEASFLQIAHRKTTKEFVKIANKN